MKRLDMYQTESNGELELTLTGLYAEMISFQNLKDMQKVLNCIHNESMSRSTSKQLLEPLFNQFTLNNTIVNHSYIGADGEFIYSRFTQRIEKIAGPDFNNMLSENLVIFRQEDGKWKIWDQLILMIKPLNTSQ